MRRARGGGWRGVKRGGHGRERGRTAHRVSAWGTESRRGAQQGSRASITRTCLRQSTRTCRRRTERGMKGGVQPRGCSTRRQRWSGRGAGG